jgi:SnoaL-like domain
MSSHQATASTFLMMIAMTTALLQPVHAQQPKAPVVQAMLDRAAIIDAINGVGVWADRKDFTKLRPLFADVVDMDYTSLAGGTPATVKADDLMKGWENGLRPFRTQHMITNHLVTVSGDTAEAISYIHALHYVPNDMGINHWQVYGTYNHRFVRTAGGWRITAMKLNKLMADGNAALSGLAANAGVQK